MEKSFINNLNREENEILIQILITCTAKISNFLIQHQDPKKYAKFMANHIDKKKYVLSTKLFSELHNINSAELYRQIDLKKLTSLDNIPESAFSKVCGEFTDRKLLINITKKKDIKDFRTKEFLNKGKMENTYKTAGRISFFKKSPDIDRIKEVLSKPRAIEYIIDTISEYDNSLIDKFLKFNVLSFIYILPQHGDILEFYAKSLSNYYKNIQLDLDTFDEFKDAISSLTEQQIELIAEKFAEAIKKKFGSNILIYILSLL